MTAWIKNFLGAMSAAAVIAQVGLLWQFNTRLTAIETKLEYVAITKSIAQK